MSLRNPVNFCDDCMSEPASTVVAIQCYTRCDICGIIRACFGPAPEPIPAVSLDLKVEDQHLARAKQRQIKIMMAKAAEFDMRWTRDELWKLDSELCKKFESQKQRFETLLTVGFRADDIDDEGAELERAYDFVLLKMECADTSEIAKAINHVRETFQGAIVVRVKKRDDQS